MDLELRPVTAAETAAFLRAGAAAFGDHMTDDDVDESRRVFEPDRSLAVFDAGSIVATAGAFTLELTLPGRPGRAAGEACPGVPAAGVSYVGVLPTHRRQGLLTRMMTAQLDDVAARGEPIAILTASEAGIYGRFGYGPASFFQSLEVDSARARFAAPAPGGSGGRMRLAEPDEAAKVLPGLYDRVRRRRPGDISRPAGYWEQVLLDRESRREGYSANWYAVHESDRGELNGYVRYRIKPNWDHGIPSARLRVWDLGATSDEVFLALWEYLLSVDLVGIVEWEVAPLDNPLAFALADRRYISEPIGHGDWVWVRFVDVAAALSARGYAADGRLVFEVTDTFRAQAGGRFELSVEGGAGRCRRLTGTGSAPGLELATSALASAYLGGVRFSTLAAAGLVRASSPHELALADALFASTPVPWCSTGF